MEDLFGNIIKEEELILVNIYADEIQKCKHSITGQEWVYTGAAFEVVNDPFLVDLIDARFAKDREGWEGFVDKNNSDIHWADVKNDANKANVALRWLDYLYADCEPSKRKFRFAILGLNMSNLNLKEFADEQQFNSIYNRFFRTMIVKALSRFFGKGVVINQILHEQGQQEDHDYFTWHTQHKLAQDFDISSVKSEIIYLPKSHKDDERSNVVQLVDMLMGIFKDLHLGVDTSTYHTRKSQLIEHRFIQEVIEQRVIRVGYNPNSRFGFSDRFDISLFPKTSSKPDDIERNLNNFYDITKEPLAYYRQFETAQLF